MATEPKAPANEQTNLLDTLRKYIPDPLRLITLRPCFQMAVSEACSLTLLRWRVRKAHDPLAVQHPGFEAHRAWAELQSAVSLLCLMIL